MVRNAIIALLLISLLGLSVRNHSVAIESENVVVEVESTMKDRVGLDFESFNVEELWSFGRPILVPSESAQVVYCAYRDQIDRAHGRQHRGPPCPIV